MSAGRRRGRQAVGRPVHHPPARPAALGHIGEIGEIGYPPLVRSKGGRVSALLALFLVLSVGSSGCLGDDIWREPFLWRVALDAGENADAAKAFASAIADLADQGGEEGQIVIDDVTALPDNIVFQNLREFLNRQSPGSGDQFRDGVRVVTDNTTQAYATLTGEAAAAYAQAAGPMVGTSEPLDIAVADRTTRVRFVIDVVLVQEPPEGQDNESPLGTVEVRLFSPDGAERAHYLIDRTRQIRDEFITGTYGDRSEVREHLGGTWRAEVHADAEGSWSLVAEAYEPKFDDYEFWQFWRADRREVTT